MSGSAITSDTAKRPPGRSTRAASRRTCGLSAERLMTQLEITTSTRVVGQRDVLDVALEELDVLDAGLGARCGARARASRRSCRARSRGRSGRRAGRRSARRRRRPSRGRARSRPRGGRRRRSGRRSPARRRPAGVDSGLAVVQGGAEQAVLVGFGASTAAGRRPQPGGGGVLLAHAAVSPRRTHAVAAGVLWRRGDALGRTAPVVSSAMRRSPSGRRGGRSSRPTARAARSPTIPASRSFLR